MFAEIAVFRERPNNHYEWIEPSPISKPDPNPFSTFKPSRMVHSCTSVFNNPQVTFTTLSHVRSDGGRFSLEDHNITKRPLPPIPPESDGNQPQRNDSRWFRKQENSQGGSSKWNSRLNGTKLQSMTRIGSVPNLLDEGKSNQRLSSSHSLEFLNIEDSPTDKKSSNISPEKTFMSLPRPGRQPPAYTLAVSSHESSPFSSGTGTVTSHDGISAPVRPPPQKRPSAEEIVHNFRVKSKSNSVLRRQRPVNVGMLQRSGVHQPSDQTDQPTSGISKPGHPFLGEDTSATHLVRHALVYHICAEISDKNGFR